MDDAERAALPSELLARAFIARSGELGWRLDDASEAARAFHAHGLAILGGEAWQIDHRGGWDIPSSADDCGLNTPTFCFTWGTKSRPGESWTAYCDRCLTETLAELVAAAKDVVPAAKYPERLRFNLTTTTEDDLPGADLILLLPRRRSEE